MKEKLAIKGRSMNLISFLTHTKTRNKIFRKAAKGPMEKGKINILAQELHPSGQTFQIEKIFEESSDTRRYRLRRKDGKNPAFFRAGQYLSVYLNIEGSTVQRPFSISSPPDQTLQGYCDITIRTTDPGFASSFIMENWKPGDQIETSGPAGDFYYQPLRDKKNLIFIGGGSGITPLYSMITDLTEHNPQSRVLLFHGAVDPSQFIFRKNFQSLAENDSDKLRYVPVCSGNSENWQGAKGFINVPLMQKELTQWLPGEDLGNCSFFICGPPAMEQNILPQLKALQIPRKQIRREKFALGQLTAESMETFSVHVNGNRKCKVISARSDETLLTAMERAGLNPPSLCRSGSCGWCRSRLISGKLKPAEGESGLRQADEKFGYVHPCSTYPRSDLEIYIPGGNL